MHLQIYVLREHIYHPRVRSLVTVAHLGPIPLQQGLHLAANVPLKPTLRRFLSPLAYLEHQRLVCSYIIDSIRFLGPV